jgi:hypothetical protein
LFFVSLTSRFRIPGSGAKSEATTFADLGVEKFFCTQQTHTRPTDPTRQKLADPRSSRVAEKKMSEVRSSTAVAAVAAVAVAAAPTIRRPR